MKRILVILSLIAISFPVFAADRHRSYHTEPSHRGSNINPYGAALGLSLLGLGVAGAYYYNHTLPPECWKEIVGYDRYGREMWEVTCH
jgi:ABC-type dipeptide/oligopeptide/nickel transport system permease subunit